MNSIIQSVSSTSIHPLYSYSPIASPSPRQAAICSLLYDKLTALHITPFILRLWLLLGLICLGGMQGRCETATVRHSQWTATKQAVYRHIHVTIEPQKHQTAYTVHMYSPNSVIDSDLPLQVHHHGHHLGRYLCAMPHFGTRPFCNHI